jgi:uncharacterized cupredoxin-like copper-binding protein
LALAVDATIIFKESIVPLWLLGIFMKKKIFATLLALTLVAVGCGQSSDTTTANKNGEISLDLSEFSFGTEGVEITAGQTVTFVLTNTGVVGHEFMVGKNLVETADGTPNGFDHDFFEGTSPVSDPTSAGMFMGAADMGDTTMDMGDETMDHGDEHAGYMVTVGVGETVRVTVTVPQDAVGERTIGCFEGNGSHWDAGMHTALTVTA